MRRSTRFTVVVSIAACVALAQTPRADAAGKMGRRGQQDRAARIPDGVYIRIRPLSNRGQRSKPAKWDPREYNAQDILAMIADLKPDVLERYTDGRLDPNSLVPVAEGRPPMTVTEFLNASMRAGSPGCIIIPRVSLHEYGKGTLFKTAKSLYDLPITPPMRILSLDNWGNINKQGLSPKEMRSLFEKLRAQGWKHIAVNMVGGVHDPQGYASIAELGVKKDDGFAPDFTKLARIKKLGYVKKRLLYIDFPAQTAAFQSAFDPDERATHLTQVLGGQQKEKGYTFVWPILQGAWDSRHVVTSAKGPFKGATLYDVMKAAMRSTKTPGRRKRPSPADTVRSSVQPGGMARRVGSRGS